MTEERKKLVMKSFIRKDFDRLFDSEKRGTAPGNPGRLLKEGMGETHGQRINPLLPNNIRFHNFSEEMK